MKRDSDEAQQLVLQLDQLQEHRPLDDGEIQQRRMAKEKILGLAAVRKIKLRQRSRLTWIKVGDANTKLFHLRASARRRKNFIPVIQSDDRLYTTQEDKVAALRAYYSAHLGAPPQRECTLNWGELRLQQHDLSDLENDITEEEIKAAVMQTPLEKVPGLDGYIGAFYKQCWDIIKADLIAAIRDIFALRGGCWNLPNSANVALIAKKEGAQTIGDYRPISIMHSVAKLLWKILANRLSPHLDTIVSHSQNAFIKGRSIHDNFQYVQGAVKHFHHSKTSILFLKLDIAKAFDSVRWEYLLEIMEQLGFCQRWRDIMALIWSSTSSRILLNGQAGRPINHGR
jgi:hypothetical protein